jgi:hypothetical protein
VDRDGKEDGQKLSLLRIKVSGLHLKAQDDQFYSSPSQFWQNDLLQNLAEGGGGLVVIVKVSALNFGAYNNVLACIVLARQRPQDSQLHW